MRKAVLPSASTTHTYTHIHIHTHTCTPSAAAHAAAHGARASTAPSVQVKHVKSAYIAPFPDSHFSMMALGPREAGADSSSSSSK